MVCQGAVLLQRYLGQRSRSHLAGRHFHEVSPEGRPRENSTGVHRALSVYALLCVLMDKVELSTSEGGDYIMTPIYLGIDIAGAANTWALALVPVGDGLAIVLPPRVFPLTEIVAYCDTNDVVGAAIDAQLSMAL